MTETMTTAIQASSQDDVEPLDVAMLSEKDRAEIVARVEQVRRENARVGELCGRLEKLIGPGGARLVRSGGIGHDWARIADLEALADLAQEAGRSLRIDRSGSGATSP